MINVTKQDFQNFHSSDKTVEQFAEQLNTQHNLSGRDKITPNDIRGACKMYGLNLKTRARGKKEKFKFIDLDAPKVEEFTEVETNDETEEVESESFFA